jgi:hypothetical protein
MRRVRLLWFCDVILLTDNPYSKLWWGRGRPTEGRTRRRSLPLQCEDDNQLDSISMVDDEFGLSYPVYPWF